MYYAVEDDLSEALLRRILAEVSCNPDFLIQLGRQSGETNVKSNLSKYLELSAQYPVVIFLDLDRRGCAVEYREHLLADIGDLAPPENFVMRIIETEAESWLLADYEGLAQLMKGSVDAVKSRRDWEKIDAKEALLDLVNRMGGRELKDGILPSKGNDAKVGMQYNLILSRFVESRWSAQRAATRSVSLRKAMDRIQEICAG